MSCGGGECTVYSAADLVTAVEDSTVGTIVVAPGHYELTGDMTGAACGTSDGPSALCIGRDLTIKAEQDGTAVLNAMHQRRVFYVSDGVVAKLLGLSITGGYAAVCSSFRTFWHLLPSPRWNVSCACFLHAG